jgi:hypothetical protein
VYIYLSLYQKYVFEVQGTLQDGAHYAHKQWAQIYLLEANPILPFCKVSKKSRVYSQQRNCTLWHHQLTYSGRYAELDNSIICLQQQRFYYVSRYHPFYLKRGLDIIMGASNFAQAVSSSLAGTQGSRRPLFIWERARRIIGSRNNLEDNQFAPTFQAVAASLPNATDPSAPGTHRATLPIPPPPPALSSPSSPTTGLIPSHQPPIQI